jgi:hypothetical protein
VPVALAALGAARRGSLGRLRGPLAALLGLLLAAALGIVALSGETFGRRWPAGLALLLGGLWLVPLALSVWAHARHDRGPRAER